VSVTSCKPTFCTEGCMYVVCVALVQCYRLPDFLAGVSVYFRRVTLRAASSPLGTALCPVLQHAAVSTGTTVW